MIRPKKVFFGSLYEFTSKDAEKILQGLTDQYEDPGEAPFVSYNARSQLFSSDVDLDDQNLVLLLNGQISSYTKLHSRQPGEILESDELKPLDGTVIRSEIQHTEPRSLHFQPLFDIIDDSSDDDSPRTIADETVYWKPKCGDISIVNADVAAEIVDETGTFLDPDIISQKVRLAQGNVQLTLERLEQLEDVMTYAAPHRQSLTSYVDTSMISLHTSLGSAIRFVRPVQPHCGYDRICVPPDQRSLLHRVVLAEVRLWKDTVWTKPLNLDLEGVPLTKDFAYSSIFREANLPVIGNAKSADPRPPSKDSSQASDELQRTPTPPKFLGQREVQRVKDWRADIDPNAAPTLPPDEPVRDEGTPKTRRRLVVDSSDEEGDEVEAKTNQPKSRSDSLPARNGSILRSADKHPASIKTPLNHEVEDSERRSGSFSAVSKPSLAQIRHNRSSTGKSKDSEPQQPTGQFGSKNMFDLIAEDYENDPDDVRPEHASSAQKASIKQTGVKFQEPMITKHATAGDQAPLSPRNLERSSSRGFDSVKYIPANSAPEFRAGSEWRYKSRTKDNNAADPSGSADSMQKSFTTPHRPQTNVQQRGSSSIRGGQRGRGSVPLRSRGNELIDITAEPSLDGPVMPPPGFDYRSSEPTSSSGTVSSPEKPTASSVAPVQHTLPSRHTRSASFVTASDQQASIDLNPPYVAPKRDMVFLKDQAAARLRAQIEANKDGKDKDRFNSFRMPPNHKQTDDEYSSRKYHMTMSQKAPKPSKGKGKNPKTQETKVEREARIAKAKAEAYGDTTTTKERAAAKPNANPQQSNAPVQMSAKKRQLLQKNSAMAELHPESLTESSNEDVAGKLLDELRPVLKATLAFKGIINVEVQLGQALILKNNRLDEGRLYAPKDLNTVFNARSQSDAKVSFTNIVSRNGQDIDRIFEIETESGSSNLWDKDTPGLVTTKIEFWCLDKAGHEFVLIVNQDREYTLDQQPSIIRKIAVHSPAQIWDACVVVSGTMKVLRPSKDILEGVEQFKQSMYIPGGKKAVIYYRLPPNNAFTIRSILMKRTSIHNCLIPKRNDIQLRITEVKALAHSSHPHDKKLYRSYESEPSIMVKHDRIHYEVAITNKDIEAAFQNNPDITLGECAAVNSPDGKIINGTQARGLVDVTTYMLSHIDWIGAQNTGALHRMHDDAMNARDTIIDTLPAHLNHNLPIPMGKYAPPTMYQPSRIGTATLAAEPVLRQLPGVRANTAAEMWKDRSTGECFYFGINGGRVPVIPDRDGEVAGAVFPDDSASQAGGVRRRGQGAATKAVLWDDKPAGFW